MATVTASDTEAPGTPIVYSIETGEMVLTIQFFVTINLLFIFVPSFSYG